MLVGQNTPYCGRIVLRAEAPPTDTAQSIGAVLDQVMPQHLENSRLINDLYWFYRGDQPILSRRKEIRPEINNRIVENRAFEVVEFKKGYEFSHPIQYVNVGRNNAAPLDALNTYARLDGKDTKDLCLAEWRYIAGTSYRITLPQKADEDTAPYFTGVLDPRTTGVVYAHSVGSKKVCSFSYSVVKKQNGKTIYRIGAYTDTQYFEWETNSLIQKLEASAATVKPLWVGKNPIVEYPLNSIRTGYVELCRHLFNAVNTSNSNRLDAVEQFVQALLVFVNTELETDAKTGEKIVPRTGDILEVVSRAGLPADVKYLIAQLDQGQTQIQKDDLLDAIYAICSMPNRNERSSGGGDTGQAVVLRNGWGVAEASAKSSSKMFIQSEMEYLRIVLAICRDTREAAGEIEGLTLKDIGIHFTRNRSDNMQVKTQSLETMLRTGVDAEDAFEISELFSDPTASYLKSKDRLDILYPTTARQPAAVDSTEDNSIVENAPSDGGKLGLNTGGNEK